jgi:hypothetical protein
LCVLTILIIAVYLLIVVIGYIFALWKWGSLSGMSTKWWRSSTWWLFLFIYLFFIWLCIYYILISLCKLLQYLYKILVRFYSGSSLSNVVQSVLEWPSIFTDEVCAEDGSGTGDTGMAVYEDIFVFGSLLCDKCVGLVKVGMDWIIECIFSWY